jgi:hypothetical protein
MITGTFLMDVYTGDHHWVRYGCVLAGPGLYLAIMCSIKADAREVRPGTRRVIEHDAEATGVVLYRDDHS